VRNGASVENYDTARITLQRHGVGPDELAASEGRTSRYGTMKMPDGHVESLTAADKYDNVTTGGPWVEGVRNQCRPKIYTHNEGFSYYYLSFRCCAEADGKKTDPRAPRQIKRGEKAAE